MVLHHREESYWNKRIRPWDIVKTLTDNTVEMKYVPAPLCWEDFKRQTYNHFSSALQCNGLTVTGYAMLPTLWS